MPRLPALFTQLVRTEPLPLGDDPAQAFQDIGASGLRIVAAQATDLLGEGVGTVLTRLGVRRGDIPAPLSAADLDGSNAFGQILAGSRTVKSGESDRALVKLCQRALQAIAARVDGAPVELALPEWGADGGFGGEVTAALAALRGWRGIDAGTALGSAEATEIRALLELAPPPDLFDPDHVIALLSKGARRIVDVAEKICDANRDAPFVTRVDGVRYSVHPQIFGVKGVGGRLRLPGGVSYSLTTDYWKCNIFGGAVLTLADLPAPTFQIAPGVRHFPRAERFGDALAQKSGWTLVKHLDHRDPADPERARTSDAIDREIRDLLKQIQPGDLFFVDHPGAPGDDGGHTRVCTQAADPDDADVAPLFAQARFDSAKQERNGMARLARGQETQFWLLRTKL